MKRPHRTAHRYLWPMIGAIVATVFVLALVLRPPIP